VFLELNQNRALLATVGWHNNNFTVAAELGRTSHCLPATPFGQLAVHRASVGVANGRGGEFGADGSAMIWKLGDGTGASHVTSTTRFGAGTVGTPLGHCAVNGALVLTAATRFGHGRTCATTMKGSLDKTTFAGLGACAASLCALGPFHENGCLAVNGARLGVAGTVLLEGGAGLATVKGPADCLAVLVLNTRATGLGADAPVSPSRNFAVHRAKFEVTLLGLE